MIRKPVFISWTRDNGRTRELAAALNVEPVFVFNRGNLLVRYMRSMAISYRLTRQATRDGVTTIVMLPPAPLAIAAAAGARSRPGLLIADLHTGFFSDPKWSWLCTVTLWVLRRSLLITTNKEVLLERSSRPSEAMVLHDVLLPKSFLNHGAAIDVLCPLSYANDEPVGAVLEAARATPDLSWTLTGHPPGSIVSKAPRNVSFSGYLTNADFENALSSARVILAVTDRPHTMQRAGYESLMLRKPLVVSGHQVLREFHGAAAVYVDNTWSGIAGGVRDALFRAQSLSTSAGDVLDQRRREQIDKLGVLQSRISRGPK